MRRYEAINFLSNRTPVTLFVATLIFFVYFLTVVKMTRVHDETERSLATDNLTRKMKTIELLNMIVDRNIEYKRLSQCCLLSNVSSIESFKFVFVQLVALRLQH